MKSFTPLVTTLSLLLSTSALADKPAAKPDPKAMARAGAEAFAKAFNARDVKAASAAVTDDVMFVFNFKGQEGKGRAALEKFLTDSFAGPAPTIALKDCDGQLVGDSILVAMCDWDDTITTPDGKQQVIPVQSSEILVKQKDGRWLVRVDHASFAPPPPPQKK